MRFAGPVSAATLADVGSAVLAARMLLAGVFVVAGIGKLLDLSGSRRSLVGFGIPEGYTPVLGTLLPVVELSVALALLLRPTAVWGGAAALILLLCFIAGLSNALRRGETPDCHCFGAVHSAPASWRQVVRNAALAGVAVFVIGWGPGPAIDTWISARSPAELVAIALGIAATALLALVIPQWIELRRLRPQLLEAQHAASAIPAGLAVGSLAPEFEVPEASGGMLSLSSLCSAGRPVLLIFSSAGCGPCEIWLPELERLREVLRDRLTIGLVGMWTMYRYDAARDEHLGWLSLNEARAKDETLDRGLVDLVELFETYRLRATPSAVVVTSEGTIASATVNGRPAIEALIRLTLARLPQQTMTPVALGEPATA